MKITEVDLYGVATPFLDILHAKYNLRFRGDLMCGLKSNIPVCCILFYVFIWKTSFLFVHFPIVKKFIYWYPPKTSCGYVPCLVCLLRKRFNKVHECDVKDSQCCMFKAKGI